MLGRRIHAAIRQPIFAAGYFLGSFLHLFGLFHILYSYLYRWMPVQARSPFSDQFYRGVFRYWENSVYLAESDPDRRERLKDRFMAGASGVNWAEKYGVTKVDRNTTYFDLSHDESLPIYPLLDEVLANSSNAIVVQIGSSSGREVAYFAARFPNSTFIGLDIDDAIAERARQRYQFSNLYFKTGRAHTCIADLSVPNSGPLIIFSNGSIQYVQPEHLSILFDQCVVRGNVLIALSEVADNCFADRLSGSKSRGNFSYVHDYKYYAENAGFKTIDFRLIVTEAANPSKPLLYYYCGSVAARVDAGESPICSQKVETLSTTTQWLS